MCACILDHIGNSYVDLYAGLFTGDFGCQVAGAPLPFLKAGLFSITTLPIQTRFARKVQLHANVSLSNLQHVDKYTSNRADVLESLQTTSGERISLKLSAVGETHFSSIHYFLVAITATSYFKPKTNNNRICNTHEAS